jgi:tetratricopeptide (TPR) repeat protein
VRYERPIHETLKFPDGVYALEENEIVIMHTGYTHSAHADTGKIERNMALLKKAIESNPEDVISKYYLADVYYALSNIDEAIPLYREVLNKTACNKSAFEWFRMHAFYYLIHLLNNTKVYDEAYALAEQAFHEFPERVNFCYLYGTVMYTSGRFDAALDAFKKAEKLAADGKIENQKLENIDALPIYLAQTYVKLDNHTEALRYAVFYLESHKQREDALKLCMHIIRSKENPENTVYSLSKIYDFKNVQNKMLLLRCAKDMGDIALAKYLIQMIAPEELQ